MKPYKFYWEGRMLINIGIPLRVADDSSLIQVEHLEIFTDEVLQSVFLAIQEELELRGNPPDKVVRRGNSQLRMYVKI